jgi:hypothetical protein
MLFRGLLILLCLGRPWVGVSQTLETRPRSWIGSNSESASVLATEARLQRVPRVSLVSSSVRVRVKRPFRSFSKQLGAK